MAYKKRTEEYFKKLRTDVDKIYSVASEARAKGYDPVDKVEIPLAMTMAEKVVGLISVLYPQVLESGMAERILELEEKYGKLDTTVAFMISEEVAKQKFCKFDNLHDAIDCGIRVGFAYQTIAVVASPIEGYTELKIEKTRDGKEYFKVYFSGPIRSAGTTASCIVLMIIDYLREVFGFAKYDPTEDEVKRYITENTDYHERITNLQYFPLEEEIEFIARHLPIQIAGEPTEKLEVSNYKNLDRVETNQIRGGMCLIFSEGLAQKAAKGFRLYNNAKANGVNATGFDWITEYLELHEKLTSGKSKGKSDGVPVYIKDLVAGRPIYGHPGRSGSFRFRYGRCSVSAFSASSLHPATMAITDNFIATGTQLKIEKPTKGTAVTVCEQMDGPIVKLINGSVKKIHTIKEAQEIYKNVEEIIYVGDILFPFSDVVNRNAMLLKPGYVEEWWKLDLIEKDKEVGKSVDAFNLSFEEAIELSKKYNVPLNPKFTFFWTQISKDRFLSFIDWLKSSVIRGGKVVFPYNQTEQEKFVEGKRALEILGVEHQVTIENVVLNELDSKILFLNLGLDLDLLKQESFLLKDVVGKLNLEDVNTFDVVNKNSEFEIKDKAGDFIGARMGRPEKAKLRKLQGSPNTLFPVGNEGGRLRSVQTACEVGHVKGKFPLMFCKACDNETIYPYCEKCKAKTTQMYYYRNMKEKSFEKTLGEDEVGETDCYRSIDIKYYYDKALEHLGLRRMDVPLLIKGVRGMSSAGSVMENFAKGILRAKNNLQVNKDGTIRYDGVELPVTHFSPREAGVSVEKLRELGYTEDMEGKNLENENQVLELMPHDIFLPCANDTMDERGDDVFMNLCNFVDEELERFYGMRSFYKVKKREDLIGMMGVFMAPHNCAGVICRFVGFSNTLGVMASPYMHAAVRRDCDGDEAAIMLLGDVLLNFSRKFLPAHRGGTQDAPLVLNAAINAGEVDDQILDLEITPGGTYPLELYQKAEKRMHSSEVKEVRIVKDVLKDKEDPFTGIGFTHKTTDFNDTVVCCSYKKLGTMKEKIAAQMRLVEKLRSADECDTARLMIDRHFMRDMRGNLRKFSMQGFRCVACNEIMRRPPLTGICPKCNGKIIFTIHEGGIKKYLQPAIDLANKYNLSTYMKQNLELVKRYIDSIFGKELEKQAGLDEFF
jgi:DNA polymerase II large subunit